MLSESEPGRSGRRLEQRALLVAVAAALVVSGLSPYDRTTWWLEVAPVLLGVPLLVATHRRFPLTALLERLLFVHALILLLGGHYSYARVPFGDWAAELFDLDRNPYDRLGHLAQGFVPAILAREILLRKTPLVRGGWLFFLATCTCLAFSAFYELLEWWAASVGGESAHEFLGTQGDEWDTQWDMFLALCGALSAQLLLAARHDVELGRAPVSFQITGAGSESRPPGSRRPRA